MSLRCFFRLQFTAPLYPHDIMALYKFYYYYYYYSSLTCCDRMIHTSLKEKNINLTDN